MEETLQGVQAATLRPSNRERTLAAVEVAASAVAAAAATPARGEAAAELYSSNPSQALEGRRRVQGSFAETLNPKEVSDQGPKAYMWKHLRVFLFVCLLHVHSGMR